MARRAKHDGNSAFDRLSCFLSAPAASWDFNKERFPDSSGSPFEEAFGMTTVRGAH